ncbi:hypothetical protein [Pseudomonas vancouverensis]|uniref:Uncharacterized protein n=1 Tax=Pseudomonas vancouverensis TaxID=95300 RepID=A0A1H2NYC5_PSEVA|nr:hypothetical protein [Pseudomonas vancouverensis]KAB0496569.1 hypothetical protein F7R09_12540 [Pseudomonas vancouverensis]TDB64723.1 hypothetical protein EIY72_09895 [Pseudomonas vancouverensis]SDV10432.1 hypothetical protein SAMN05216558_3243 [Pseudomonas vancouverensis]
MYPFGEVSTHVESVRGQVLIAALAMNAKCAPSPYAMAAWQDRKSPGASEKEPVPWGLLKAWRRRFKGAIVRDQTRKAWFEEFSDLREVYDNLLWFTLNFRTPHTAFDTGISFFRLNGDPLSTHHALEMSSLFECPDWSQLGYLICYLRCQAKRFAIQQAWAAKNFFPFFALACLRPPCRCISVELYELLDDLIKDNRMAVDARMWPHNSVEFLDYLVAFDELGDHLIANQYVSEWGEECLIWIWQLVERRNLSLLQAIDRSLHETFRPDIPRRFQERITSAIVRHGQSVLGVGAHATSTVGRL